MSFLGGETFGAEVAGWGGGDAIDAALTDAGEVEVQQSDEQLPGEIPLGGGIKMRINPAFFRMIMPRRSLRTGPRPVRRSPGCARPTTSRSRKTPATAIR
jgi:hypothetical protein